MNYPHGLFSKLYLIKKLLQPAAALSILTKFFRCNFKTFSRLVLKDSSVLQDIPRFARYPPFLQDVFQIPTLPSKDGEALSERIF